MVVGEALLLGSGLEPGSVEGSTGIVHLHCHSNKTLICATLHPHGRPHERQPKIYIYINMYVCMYKKERGVGLEQKRSE